MFKKPMFIMIFVAVISMAVATCNAEEVKTQSAKECVQKTLLKGYGWSALYGGGILVIGAGLGIATAPVAIPTATIAAIIGSNAIVGSALGIGSSAVTRISDQAELGTDVLSEICLRKSLKEKVGKFISLQ